MAAVEETVRAHERELQVHRDRWHDSEGDRAAVRQLTKAFEGLPAAFEKLARSIALEVFASATANRADTARKESSHRLQWAAIAFTALGFLASLLFQLRG